MYLTFREATSLIYNREGPMGFLRGLAPSLVKNTGQAGCFFSILFYSEETLKAMNLFTPTQIQSLSGATARTIQTIVFNPLVIIKTRFEVVGFQEYSGMLDAGRQILQKEGVRGLTTGMTISLIRDVPFSALFYPTYTYAKLLAHSIFVSH